MTKCYIMLLDRSSAFDKFDILCGPSLCSQDKPDLQWQQQCRSGAQIHSLSDTQILAGPKKDIHMIRAVGR